MRRKNVSKQAGVTLIELLAALAISMLLIGIIFGVLTSSIKYKNKTESHINLRQEANIMITEMRKQHQEAKTNYSLDLCDGKVEFNENISMDNIELMGVSKCKDDQINPLVALPVKFTLIDEQNHNQFTIDTVIEGKRSSDSVVIQKPVEQSFAEYVRTHGIFVYVDKMELKSTPDIIGPQGTVVIKEGIEEVIGGDIFIEAQDIYIRGNVFLKNSKLGNSNLPVSNIYIAGNVDINGGSSEVNGYLKYTGNLYDDKNAITSSEKVTSIPSFPNYAPALKETSWYEKQNYSSDPILKDNMRYFGESIELNNNNKAYNNIIIVSKGHIYLKNVNVTGILFAPQGTVEIENASEFTGIIIAKKFVSTNGNTTVNFQMPKEDVQLPF